MLAGWQHVELLAATCPVAVAEEPQVLQDVQDSTSISVRRWGVQRRPSSWRRSGTVAQAVRPASGAAAGAERALAPLTSWTEL
jgi:hypothetical protein